MSKTKIFGIVLSVLFLASVTVGMGFGAYFFVLYMNRDENHRFEAAYLYDTTFSKSVDVELGAISPGESVTQSIPVVSKINKNINIVFTFATNSEETFDYIFISFDDQEESASLDEYITTGKKYVVEFKGKESKSVEITYTMLDVDIPMKHSIDFSIFIKAYDTHYEW